MAITPRIEIKQSQSLAMTTSLKQAISMLALSNQELSEVIENEILENPLLAKDDGFEENAIEESSDEDSSLDMDYENDFDDFGSDRQGYDVIERKINDAPDDFDFYQNQKAKENSLYEVIKSQINIKFVTNKDKIIANNLMQEIDAAGYFVGDVANIAKRLKIVEKDVENVLDKMKTFEPSGIFGQSLKEVLSIQLKDKNLFDPMMEKLLENLNLLAERKLRELKEICLCDDEDLHSMIADIKACEPKPAKEFDNDLATYVVPDVMVRTNKKGEYIVELNQASLPRLLINNEYKSLVKKDKVCKKYINQNLSKATFLIKAMNQRADTLLSVAEHLVATQRAFFENGVEYIKPLTAKESADILELSESTISRVTTNKYMATPQGFFELKYFFSNKAGSYIGNEDVSTISIKHKIKKMIDAEGPKPLSDDKIAELLAQEGVKIARRTVAKYREGMGLGSSSQRKLA